MKRNKTIIGMSKNGKREMKKYKVGDTIWVASFRGESREHKCPVCFGKKEVSLILGDDTKVALPCHFCSRGLTSPSGTITEWEYVAKAELRIIDETRTNETKSGTVKEYLSDNRLFYDYNVFDTKEEAIAHSKIQQQEFEKEQETKAEYIKKDSYKSYSWNAGYWLTQIKNAKADIKRYKKQIRLCKEKVKK